MSVNAPIKYFSLDIVFKVVTKRTKCFVKGSGPLPQGMLFQGYYAGVEKLW